VRKSDEGYIFPREIIILGFLNSPMTLQKISLDHEDLQVPVRPVLSQPPADHSGRMTNHGNMFARGNGATEKGSPNMHTTLLKYIKFSRPQSCSLFVLFLPFSSIGCDFVETGVDSGEEKLKRRAKRPSKSSFDWNTVDQR
jgi:hypothetical protein